MRIVYNYFEALTGRYALATPWNTLHFGDPPADRLALNSESQSHRKGGHYIVAVEPPSQVRLDLYLSDGCVEVDAHSPISALDRLQANMGILPATEGDSGNGRPRQQSWSCIVIDIDNCPTASLFVQSFKETGLGIEVFLFGLMKVEMISGKIGEYSRVELDPLYPVKGQPVG